MQKSKLDKVWTTDEVDTSIYKYMSEQCRWDNTHSGYSRNDVRQKTLAKFQEKFLSYGYLSRRGFQ